LDLLTTITLKIAPFHAYAQFPALLPVLNASWKLCSVRVFRTAYSSALITSLVSEWWYLQSRKQRKVAGSKVWVSRVGRDSGHVVLGKKFSGENQCTVVMQQPVLFVTEFGAKSSPIFTNSP
jgi:hypothetical protein